MDVPKNLIDQVIGQDKAVKIIKKAAAQKRNVLLIGSPGTGKSMLAQAMAELLPLEELEDVLVLPNPNNENQPKIEVVKTYPTDEYLRANKEFRTYYTPQEAKAINTARINKELARDLPSLLKLGLGRRITTINNMIEGPKQLSPIVVFIILAIIAIAIWFYLPVEEEGTKIFLIGLLAFLGIIYSFSNAFAGLKKGMSPQEANKPKLIVDNSEKICSPFIDATGTRAGALLGDCRHDPLQTGGLGTPAHLRIEAGAIHRANKGVLFIDEIASLKINWQQELLTAMQEKRYSITGQSEMGSGALVKSEPAPTDFVLVAAGNLPDMKAIHPALRSRIRGGGYEVYVEDTMPDSPENEEKLVQFVAQEIDKDKKIPHFTYEAVQGIIEEARKFAGRKHKFTLNLRELGGLVRAAGDVAAEEKAEFVEPDHVERAKKIFKSIEGQLGSKIIEQKKEYQTIITSGKSMGRVNGLAVLGASMAGLVLPIVAEITPAASTSEGKVIATGKLGQIAKEAVENVSAIIKKHIGTDIAKMDIHIQFLQTYEGLEGDSASISTAVAVISAMAEIPVSQEVAMTGSLDVRGGVLPVGGVSSKIEAAIDSGIKKVLVPKSNMEDIYLSQERAKKIKIVPVNNIVDVLEHSLDKCKEKEKLLKKISKQFEK
jgi:Lon-like ATP-dependent protease